MRRSLAGFVFLILAATAALPARGAEMPVISGPAAYRGNHGRENAAYRVFLHLGQAGDFVLREEADLPNGKVSAWDITGKWHQIRNGTLLQLANRTGYRRTANVGGSGQMYLDVQLPSGRRETIILRGCREDLPEFTVSGTLGRAGGGIVLRDAATGMDHAVAEEKTVAGFLAAHGSAGPFFVRAVVAPNKARAGRPALHIKAVQAIPAPKHYGNNADASVFREIVCNARWRVTRLGPEIQRDVRTLFFLPPEGPGGRVDVFDGVRLIAGKYALQNENLSMVLPDAANALSDPVSRVKSWDLMGEVLELRGTNGVVAVLEKVR